MCFKARSQKRTLPAMFTTNSVAQSGIGSGAAADKIARTSITGVLFDHDIFFADKDYHKNYKNHIPEAGGGVE